MPFLFRKQPLKAIYFIYAIPTILFIRLPYWICSSLFPSRRPVRTWNIARSVFVHALNAFMDIVFNVGPPIMAPSPPEYWERESQRNGFTWVESVPELIVGEIAQKATLNGVKAERVSGFWYGEKGEDGKYGQKAKEDEKVVLYIHGGGFIIGGASPDDINKAAYDGILDNAPNVSRIFSLNYRLSSIAPFPPANHFPAALIDALAGFAYLVRSVGFVPGNVIVAGDSAGGLLALSLARYLVMYKIQLALGVPGGLIMFSPLAEFVLTHDKPRSSWATYRSSDTVQHFFNGYALGALLGRLSVDEGARSSWISPASLRISEIETKGLYGGLLKTLIICGGAEQLRDSIRTLVSRMKADLSDGVTYFEQPGGSHIYMLFPFFEPERAQCYQRVGRWLRDL